MKNVEKCTVALQGGPYSQRVMGNTSRLNQSKKFYNVYSKTICGYDITMSETHIRLVL